jgi:hypothetical protein
MDMHNNHCHRVTAHLQLNITIIIIITSALEGVGGPSHAPAALAPEKDPVPIVWEAGWAPEPVWSGAENLAHTGIRSQDRSVRSDSLYQLAIVYIAIVYRR